MTQFLAALIPAAFAAGALTQWRISLHRTEEHAYDDQWGPEDRTALCLEVAHERNRAAAEHRQRITAELVARNVTALLATRPAIPLGPPARYPLNYGRWTR